MAVPGILLRFAGIQAGRAALETGMEWGLAEVTGDESFTANYALWALSRNFTLNMLTGGAARYFDALEGAGKMTARLNRLRKYLPAGEYVAETALETAGEVIFNDRDLADVLPQIAISNALTAGISLAGAGRRALRLSSRAESGFGVNGLYRPPAEVENEAVRAAYLAEVRTLSFKVKLALHNILTPGRRWVTPSMIRSKVASASFGKGPFSVKQLERGGQLLFGGGGESFFLYKAVFSP